MPRFWTESGRGRKLCEHCGAYYASRAMSCSQCGKRPYIRRLPTKKKASFPVKTVERVEMKPEEMGPTDLVVPAGRPPVPLTEYDRASIQMWAQAVVDDIEAKGEHTVILQALSYWVRKTFSGDEQIIALHYLEHWNRLYRR